MPTAFLAFVQSAAISIAVLAAPAGTASATDCCRHEPRPFHNHGCGHYVREGGHGLVHYPGVSYWLSQPAPSPWAYHSVAPYPHHYHFHYGDGSGDCRN